MAGRRSATPAGRAKDATLFKKGAAMKYKDFLGHVQNRARLATLEEAAGATRATLQSLGERIPDEEVRHLQAQLPVEIAYYLDQVEKTERFGVKDFFVRVSERENEGLLAGTYHARAVIDVLKEAVPDELDDLIATLPDDWRQLFEAGSEGEMDVDD